jgi:Protein of unknown function (DUF3306)
MKERADPERFSLSRWSQRKLAAKAAPAQPPAATSAAAAPATAAPAAAAPSASPTSASPSAQLPSIDSLGFDSDFTAFLRPEVDEELKRAALKQLFRDPRFNVMDGLDTYIDDYTKADPIEPDVVADLLKRGFGPPAQPAAPLAGGGTVAATPEADRPFASEIASAGDGSDPLRTCDGALADGSASATGSADPSAPGTDSRQGR